PDAPELRREMGWVLHGNISHLAIRRHIYNDKTTLPVQRVITMHVAAFLAGVPSMVNTFE
ncbi:MAG: TetR/AcrR family transcriptional regulator, partial [Hydrogenophaga sp.]|nr:TetR/AcrR family transcriptional regulator [Hydrogenophaga sp.]